MFTTQHFIWLFIGLVIIVALFVFTKKNIINQNIALNILLVVSVISETTKMLINMEESVKGGMHLEVGSLPFHLCSVQIFFLFATKFMKDENKKAILESFMSLTMLIGGILAILIPTCGVKFTRVQVYQYFLFHFFIIYYALNLMFVKKVDMGVRAYARNVCLLLLMVVLGLWINSILSFADTNFLYLTRPPMSGLPILNLDNGWYAYFFSLLFIGILLVSLLHLPFIIKEKKNK